MATLKKVSEYIVELEKTFGTLDSVGFKGYASFTTKYANFVTQKLILGMFVACDENGNVLEEPNRSTHTNTECEQYAEAKEKVIFEDAKIERGLAIGVNDNIQYLCIGDLEIAYKIDNIDKKFIIDLNETTIEDLIPYNLEITENIKKQFNL